MHFDDPVSEALDDEVLHGGMIAIHGIAASRVIGVFSLGLQHVIDGVVESAECNSRSQFGALAAVVKDDVEDDFDLGFVKRFDHLSEFFDGGAGGLIGGVALEGAEETDRRIAPIVGEVFSGVGIDECRRFLGVVGGDGKEFDRGDAHFFEVRDSVDESQKCAGMRGVCRGMLCHAFDVAFIDDGFGEGVFGAAFAVPRDGSAR